AERGTAIGLFGGAANTSNIAARAQALRQVAEDRDLYNAEFNGAFVLMQYFGDLRRNPNDLPDNDYTGYEFWLNKLNQFNGDFIGAEMIKAFISSIEYRSRFAPTFNPPTPTPTPTPTPSPSPGGTPMPAPPVDLTVTTTVSDSTKFLYTGSSPIQTGVAPGTIKPIQAAVLRGRVVDSNNAALPGVTITILNHPEFGQTLTRSDGMFDMAVNGGGLLTVNYRKEGYLPLQRQMDVPWQDYSMVHEVCMIPVDPSVTLIDLSNAAAIQVARGTTVSDTAGQ